MLTTIQVIIALILIALILIQERSSGMSGLFGGGGGDGGAYQKRRGVEKSVFIATIVMAVLFAGVSVANLMY